LAAQREIAKEQLESAFVPACKQNANPEEVGPASLWKKKGRVPQERFSDLREERKGESGSNRPRGVEETTVMGVPKNCEEKLLLTATGGREESNYPVRWGGGN